MIRRILRLLPTAAPVLLLLALCGCGAPADDAAGIREPFLQVIGGKGFTSGRFDRPRGIRYEPEEDLIHVLDWSGRMQMFRGDGSFRSSWKMPATDKGKAEDFIILPNKNYLIVDTHYSRVVEFDRQGQELRSWGSYGRGPGQFIYPVGIAQDAEGCIYVSEYGENDRIQKFSADGELITSWGRFGRDPGDFERPSGLCISHNQRLFVADGVMHRIQVFDLNGTLLQVFGKEGDGPGEFSYPYDVESRGDFLYVLEYGNSRVQKLTLSGEPVAIYKGAPGEDGLFALPWRFDVGPESVFVSDTQNDRVCEIRF